MPTQKEVTVFKYDELTDKAKERARNEFLQNFDFDTEFLKDEFIEDLKAIGISANTKDLNWAAERGREWFFCIRNNGSIEDFKLFAKYCKKAGYKIDLRKQKYKDAYPSIETQHFAGARCENYITLEYDTDEELTQALQDKYEEFLKRIESEWEYETSEEYIKETIEANEYEFRESGELFY
jgi:hypothetical protein